MMTMVWISPEGILLNVQDIIWDVFGERSDAVVLKEGVHYGPHNGWDGNTYGNSIKKISELL